jgi:hypothetical protein
MESTFTTKEKRQLVQIVCKWGNELNKDKLKHKFYTTHNLWEEVPLPSL